MKATLFTIIVLLSVLGLSGCGSDPGFDKHAASPSGLVRVIHAVPDAPLLVAEFGKQSLGQINYGESGAITRVIPDLTRETTISFVEQNKLTELTTVDVLVPQNQLMTLIIAGTMAEPQIIQVNEHRDDSAENETNAGFSFVHAAAKGPEEIQLTLTDDLADSDTVVNVSKYTSSPYVSVVTRKTLIIIFAFSEAVSGFADDDIIVSSGTLSNISPGEIGTSYTATFTPNDEYDGNISISVANDAYTDSDGNPGLGDTITIQASTATPRMAITSSPADFAAGETATITFTFSETTLGFTDSDITVSGGTLDTINSSDEGLTYTAIFTPAPEHDGNFGIAVANDAYTDSDDNYGTGDVWAIQATTDTPTLAIVANTDNPYSLSAMNTSGMSTIWQSGTFQATAATRSLIVVLDHHGPDPGKTRALLVNGSGAFTFPEESLQAALRLVNLIPDQTAVDIYSNDELISQDLLFTDQVPYMALNTGSYQIKVTTANDPENILLEETTFVYSGEYHSLYVSGLADAISPLLVIDNNRTIKNLAQLNIIQNAPSSDLLDLYLVKQGESIADVNPNGNDISPLTIAGFTVEADSYDVVVTGPSDKTILTGPETVQMDAGHLYRILIRDPQGGGNPPVIVVTEEGIQ
jgi:hypothetical protein